MPFSATCVGLVGLFVVLLVSSCATIQPSSGQQTQSWDKRVAQLERYASISCQARVNTVSNGRAWQFSLHWQQTGDSFNGAGYSFFGSQLFAIYGNEEVTNVADSNTTQRLPSNQAIGDFTGLDLNPSQLFYLIAALPMKGATQTWSEEWLESQTIQEIQVRYLGWESYAGLTMPRRLKIHNPTHTVTLTFTAWQFDTTEQ